MTGLSYDRLDELVRQRGRAIVQSESGLTLIAGASSSLARKLADMRFRDGLYEVSDDENCALLRIT